MGNTILHYSFNDVSSYGQPVKLGTDIQTLMENQSKINKDSFGVVDPDDAATLEISELARTMYAASSGTVIKKDTNSIMESASNVVEENDDADKYAGLSVVEREQKELEDYIASHPVDQSLNLMRHGSLLKQMDGSEAKMVDEALIIAEKEYTEAFTDAAKDFADFSMKITYGDYTSNDVSVNDLNFEAIDKMEDLYRSYQEQITSNYEGEERTKYLNKLDEVYNSVFAENIIDPIKSAYDDKLTFFQPDSEETMRSIKAASSDQGRLQEMVSGYLANQSIQRNKQSTILDGTKEFYSLAEDTSLWHNTAAIKDILTDSMNVYSSVKEAKINSSEYLSAKAAADAIAKKVSDAYAENLAYREEKLGLTKNGEDTQWSQIAYSSIRDYITTNASGIYFLDFSTIPNLKELLADR